MWAATFLRTSSFCPSITFIVVTFICDIITLVLAYHFPTILYRISDKLPQGFLDLWWCGFQKWRSGLNVLKDLIVNFKLFLVALFLEFWRWWSRGLQFLLAAFRSLVNSLFKVENPTLSSALMAVKLFARFTSDSDGIVRNKIENLRSEMHTLQPTDFIYTTTKELISAIPARLCSCQQEIISILCHCHLKPRSTECKSRYILGVLLFLNVTLINAGAILNQLL